MVKVCPNCGFANDDNAVACLKCGYPFSEIVLAELPFVVGEDRKSVFTIKITNSSLVVSQNDTKIPSCNKKLNSLLGVSLAEFTAISALAVLFNFPLVIIPGIVVGVTLLLIPKRACLSEFVKKMQLEGQRLFIMKHELLDCNKCEALKIYDIESLKISGENESCVLYIKENGGSGRKFYIPNLNPDSLYNFLSRTSWKDKLVK
ncbi:MAG: zinc ribbon domain-containing protein [Sulfolobus sp.]